jgi:hypothetical protein
MSEQGFGKRIGNRNKFALEFELHENPREIWNEWWGNLWLWVDGRIVGRPSEYEMVFTGLDSLTETAAETGTRVSPIVSARSAKEALEMVMWARYGDPDPVLEKIVGAEELLFSFEVLPRLTGPFFDDWEAILVEEETNERFIYRERKSEIVEVSWPLGTFSTVVNESRRECEMLARSMLKKTGGIH